VHCFVETGTNKAETTAWAAAVFAKVYTIEGHKPCTPMQCRATHTVPTSRSSSATADGFSRGSWPRSRISRLWLDAHWPDIAALCRILTTPPHERYMFVHEDVLVAVPLSTKGRFVDHLRSLKTRLRTPLRRTTAPPQVPARSADAPRRGSGTFSDTSARVGADDARAFPRAQIYSLDPLAGPHAEIAAKTGGEPRCRTIRCALGEAAADIEMRPCTYTPSSSLFPMTDLHREAFPFTAGEGPSERIEVRRLDDVAAELDLQDEILAKIDVPGFGGHVTRGGMETLRRSRAIIVETGFARLDAGQLFTSWGATTASWTPTRSEWWGPSSPTTSTWSTAT